MISYSGHITPNWEVGEYHRLPYKQATIHNAFLDQYINSGHNNEQIQIFNYFEPAPMPSSIEYIKGQFNNLTHVSAAVNLMFPGQYLPHHSDLYERWLSFHSLDDINKVYRAIVMLANSEPGQVLQIKNNSIGFWTAGDWFAWTGATSHAIYNFSTVPRYAIQITGYLQ